MNPLNSYDHRLQRFSYSNCTNCVVLFLLYRTTNEAILQCLKKNTCACVFENKTKLQKHFYNRSFCWFGWFSLFWWFVFQRFGRNCILAIQDVWSLVLILSAPITFCSSSCVLASKTTASVCLTVFMILPPILKCLGPPSVVILVLPSTTSQFPSKL